MIGCFTLWSIEGMALQTMAMRRLSGYSTSMHGVVSVSGDTVPSAQQHRIIGLLLGYSVKSIRQHEEHISGRRFRAPSRSVVSDEQPSNSHPAYSPSTAETYLHC